MVDYTKILNDREKQCIPNRTGKGENVIGATDRGKSPSVYKITDDSVFKQAPISTVKTPAYNSTQ